MIDIKNYEKLKLKNAVSLVKAGDSYAAAYKKFDVNTGDNLPDEVLGLERQELLDRKQVLQDEIAEIDVVIADCDTLDAKTVEK